MRRLFALLALLSALAAPLPAAAQEESPGQPQVRVHLPEGEHIAGQPISMDVDVLVPNFFMGPPQFPVIDIPGAVVTLSDDRAANFSDKVDGVDYSGIRRTYRIVPQQAGTFTLPPAQIPFGYAATPGKSTPGSVTLPPLRFTITAPAGAEAKSGLVPTAPLTITQKLEPDPASLKAGGSLTRTITVIAPGLPAMTIPPPAFTTPAGATLYRHDPVLSDAGGDGWRSDRVTYVFSKAGTYTLPEIAVDWYDRAARKAEIARAPALNVQVAAAAPATTAIPPEAPSADRTASPDWSRLAIRAAIAVLSMAGTILLVRVFRGIRERLRARRRARAESEPAYFRRALAACRTNNPVAAYRALDAWLRRSPAARADFGHPALNAERTELERMLFGRKAGAFTAWRGDGLAAALSETRQHRPSGRPQQHPALPGLNPYGRA